MVLLAVATLPPPLPVLVTFSSPEKAGRPGSRRWHRDCPPLGTMLVWLALLLSQMSRLRCHLWPDRLTHWCSCTHPLLSSGVHLLPLAEPAWQRDGLGAAAHFVAPAHTAALSLDSGCTTARRPGCHSGSRRSCCSSGLTRESAPYTHTFRWKGSTQVYEPHSQTSGPGNASWRQGPCPPTS